MEPLRSPITFCSYLLLNEWSSSLKLLRFLSLSLRISGFPGPPPLHLCRFRSLRSNEHCSAGLHGVLVWQNADTEYRDYPSHRTLPPLLLFPKSVSHEMTSSQPHFLTFCPDRKWTMLPNLFLIMSILSWLHFLSDSLICNILSDSADPASWSSLLEVTLLQLCLARACPTDVNTV